MTTKPYTPQTGSIAHQVCRYFQRLTDEELSTADISIKWNIESGNVLNPKVNRRPNGRPS